MTGALLWYLLAIVIVLDVLRGRRKLAEFPVAAKAAGAVDAEYALLTAQGAEIDDEARAAAAGFARQAGADAVALIAQDSPTIPALGLVQVVDRDSVRLDRLARIKIAGSALLVRREILARAGLQEGALSTEVLRQAATKIRRYAEGEFQYLIVPGMQAPRGNPFAEWKAYRGLFGQAAGAILFITIGFVALLWAGVWLFPTAGAVALLAFHLQPMLTLAGGALHPRQLFLTTLLRSPWVLWEAIRLMRGSLDRSETDTQIRVLGPVYQELYEKNHEHFFQAPLDACPVCSATRLSRHLVTRDLFQNKPGRFRLDRCADCGHIFQNPCLSPVGLDYYYRDFYDGLGREAAEAFFGLGIANQRNQVETVTKICRPSRWLDVGGGHGHLCQIARGVLPDTRFEALDVSNSIEEAERSGWIQKGHRGFFPVLAPEMEDHFDLVSMFHYLEHTIDQRAELSAAYTAVAPGGHVVIEVPNPESLYRRLLGKYWLPWLQPQHLHLTRLGNLEGLLREAGFEPVESFPVAGSHKGTLLLAAVLLTNRLGPEPDAPWRRPASMSGRLRRYAVQSISPVLIACAVIGDRLVGAVCPPEKIANAYRVIARSSKR